MIPARLGSQRLKKKNLQLLKGKPLITHAINKAKEISVFDEIWVNSESEEIGQEAIKESVGFYKRPEHLANNIATSEDFVYDFLMRHECDYVVQVHSIAPLLTAKELRKFINYLKNSNYDCLLSCEELQIECAFKNTPVNFTYQEKTNSQDLEPILRITWSVSAWKRATFIQAYENKQCATYSGNVGYYPLNKLASHIIKTEQDLSMAEHLYSFVHGEN